MTCSPATRIRVLIIIPPFCVNAREIPPGHTSCVNMRLYSRVPRKAWSDQRCGRRAPTGRPGERSPGCRLDDRHGPELSKDFEHPLSTHPKRRQTFRMFRRPHSRPQSRYGGMPRRRRIIRTRHSSPEETAQGKPAPRILRVIVTRDGWRDRTWWRSGVRRGCGTHRSRDRRHRGKARRSRSARPSRAGSSIHRTCTASVTCCIGKTPSASGPSRLNTPSPPSTIKPPA